MPTPPAPAWISAVSPACSRPNSKRQSSAVPNGTGTAAASSVLTPSGIFQAKPAGHRAPLGVRAVEPDRHGAVPHREALHVGAHLGHRAGGLVADDVRHPGQVAAEPAEGVAALDAHRLDVDQDVARRRPPGRARPRSGRRRAPPSRSTPRLSYAFVLLHLEALGPLGVPPRGLRQLRGDLAVGVLEIALAAVVPDRAFERLGQLVVVARPSRRAGRPPPPRQRRASRRARSTT